MIILFDADVFPGCTNEEKQRSVHKYQEARQDRFTVISQYISRYRGEELRTGMTTCMVYIILMILPLAAWWTQFTFSFPFTGHLYQI